MLDRSIPPSVGELSGFEFIRAHSSKISSGIPLHLIESGHHDIVLVEFIFRSGKWYEGQPGISFFSSRMLMEGSGSMTSREIADFFESHGARFEIQTGSDLVIFSVYVLNKNFEKVIGVLNELFLHPLYPREELEIMKEIQIQQIRVNDKKNNIRAGKEFRKLIYGGEHPYGRALEIRDIEKYITAENLQDYYRRQLLSGMEIVLSGKLNSRMTGALEIFSGIPIITGQEPASVFRYPDITEKRIPVDDSSQISIRYGRRIIHKNHEDHASLVVLNELLGGFFGSRLMKNVREDKGYTYGIHSSLVHQIRDSYWIIGTDVKKESAEDTLWEIRHEFKRLRDESVDSEELEMVRNYLMGNFLSSIETSFSLADKFKNIYFFNLGYEYYDNYLDSLRSISSGRIREMANKYLDDDEFRLVMVG
ncbi:MAG: insulinase family protein [Cyclobacteriaceae bacterium]|nr:insulinase family protein [Cyclobacteriaceae bacterium]